MTTASREKTTTPAARVGGFLPFWNGTGASGNWSGRLLAGCLLIGLLPLLIVIALLVKLTSSGPVIYRQVRLGRGGRCFNLLKFRTMHNNAEAATGAVWAAENDCRITGVGHILRRLSLDELPQLVNILRGDMAFVGPRPERPEIAAVLRTRLPQYMERLEAPCGLTGLAQINLPADSDLNSVRRKLQLDLEYVEAASGWLDLRIFVATFPRLLGGRGVWLAHLLGVRRSEFGIGSEDSTTDSGDKEQRQLDKSDEGEGPDESSPGRTAPLRPR